MQGEPCKWVLSLIVAVQLQAAINVSLLSSVPSPQPLGTPIRWTATGADPNPGQLEFRFQLRAPGEPRRIVRDFHKSASFAWTPFDREGNFDIAVTVRNRVSGETNTATDTMTITSRVTGNVPVVTSTPNRLVKLYSAPPCPEGAHMRVRFRTGTAPFQYSHWKPCRPDISLNFLLAGLRPQTSYSVIHDVAQSGIVTPGAPVAFSTAALLPELVFPAVSMIDPPDPATCVLESVVLLNNVGFTPTQTSMPVATDLAGRIIWYYSEFASPDQQGTAIYRPLRGGTLLAAADDPSSPIRQQQLLREIDLAGSVVRETNVDRVSEQLVAMRKQPITSFHHDMIRLPNGNLMALASNKRLLTDVQGLGTIDVIGDALVELDQDLQVVWAWDAFDHLDTSRMATLNETCGVGQNGCPPLTKALIANDWLHSNSLHYTPDGNIIISIRHQDWVVKIEYLNGTGSGRVLWRLGNGGDFQIASSDPYPWFSHQHDAEFDIAGVPLMSIFDNGNVRKTQFPAANSRGQVFWIDEPARTAALLVNADLQTYSSALGSAERVCNGNFQFTSGVILPDIRAQSVEVSARGAITYVLETRNAVYRSFRMFSLYEP